MAACFGTPAAAVVAACNQNPAGAVVAGSCGTLTAGCSGTRCFLR